MQSVRVIGAGRAGRSLAGALAASGWSVEGLLGRADDVAAAAHGVDLLVIATPDAAVAGVAAQVGREPSTVVAHLSGALGPGPLHGHPRWAVIHPLVSMPDPATGAERLRGAWFGLAGDPLGGEVVAALGGRSVAVPDRGWATYHAAAAVASNHLVGLLGQVERIAAGVGIPLESYLDLVRGSVDNVAALGPAAALTGPVRRGDWETVQRHLDALPADERAAYEAGVALCRRLLP